MQRFGGYIFCSALTEFRDGKVEISGAGNEK